MTKDKTVEEGMVFAIIGYFWILFLVPLLAKKDNKFAVYHAKQGLMLFIVSTAAWIAAVIVSMILVFIPIVGWVLSSLIWLVICIGIFALWIIGIINSATGKYKPLPVIGGIAEKWKI